MLAQGILPTKMMRPDLLIDLAQRRLRAQPLHDSDVSEPTTGSTTSTSGRLGLRISFLTWVLFVNRDWVVC